MLSDIILLSLALASVIATIAVDISTFVYIVKLAGPQGSGKIQRNYYRFIIARLIIQVLLIVAIVDVLPQSVVLILIYVVLWGFPVSAWFFNKALKAQYEIMSELLKSSTKE